MNKLALYCPKCGSILKAEHKNGYACSLATCDYYLTDSDVIDISFKSKGIAKALSNLCNYPFIFDGVYCSCMEAFIQSLKVKDLELQKDICSKTGPFCYSIRELWDDWRETGYVYWRGECIYRRGVSYINLLIRAYNALYEQSAIFRYAINESKKYKLDHSIGCNDSHQTLLTPIEYIYILNELRKR